MFNTNTNLKLEVLQGRGNWREQVGRDVSRWMRLFRTRSYSDLMSASGIDWLVDPSDGSEVSVGWVGDAGTGRGWRHRRKWRRWSSSWWQLAGSS